jgi:predicted ester cyclase
MSTDVTGLDIEALLAPPGPRTMPMTGFDTTYVDLTDYILRCTHRIWEQKDIGLIETHYSAECPIHTATGTGGGLDSVIAGTTATLAGFPDRTLYGEAVIWSGDEAAGYLSSHRITSHATHRGVSPEFGPPTGRAVTFTTIADCLCRENRIVEEWLVRDNSAIALGLGLSPRALAKGQADTDRAKGRGRADWRLAQIEALRASPATPFPDTPAPSEPEAFAHWLVDTLWAHRRFGAVRAAYAPNARAQTPGGRWLFGHGEIIGWLTALFSTFPDARIAIDHVAFVETGRGTEIAVRWRMAGRHAGPALYGAPSGEEVLILAVTHWTIRGGLIREEWTVFDEIAVLRQIEGGL